MAERMKLSIIVPVYNTARDGMLRKCLDSLAHQTIQDYEVITVNDASTDDSLDILFEYESRYPDRFKVITYEKNRHQGGARNAGIEQAKGEWIGFIDSDDWITPDFYEKLITKGETTGADVVGCQYQIVTSHDEDAAPGQVVINHSEEIVGVLDEEKHKAFLVHPGSMVVKVYRGSLIRENHLRFPENMFYEDNYAGPVWSLYYRHFELVDEPLYYYYQNPNSTVHTISMDRLYDRMKACEMVYEEVSRLGLLERYREEIESLFIYLYFKNTLFSYMLSDRKEHLSFVLKLKKGMLRYFPEFRSSKYYRVPDAEEAGMIDLCMKNAGIFYLYYSALWFYRRHIRGVGGKHH